MIVGNGSLANLIEDREGAIFFCAGVGDSQCQDRSEFDREKATLLHLKGNKECLIYFSSISIFHKVTPYIEHKHKMEAVVRDNFRRYVIVRLGNVWGCTNPKTFINSIRLRRSEGEQVEIADEYRYMIDPWTLNKMLQSIPLDSRIEFSLFSSARKVVDIIEESTEPERVIEWRAGS